MYLLFSPIHLNKAVSILGVALLNLTKSFLFTFIVLDRKAEYCNLAKSDSLADKCLYATILDNFKLLDNLPRNLEIGNERNKQIRNSLGFSPLYGHRFSLKNE